MYVCVCVSECVCRKEVGGKQERCLQNVGCFYIKRREEESGGMEREFSEIECLLLHGPDPQ